MTRDEFWLRYLRAHRNGGTRALHYAGSVLAVGSLLLAIVTSDWRWLIAAPGSATAWPGPRIWRLNGIGRRHSVTRCGRC
jgi:hypothetical protein